MAKVHDKFVIELAEVIKGYGNDPDVDDPFRLSEFYRFYELPEIAVSANHFKTMIPLEVVEKNAQPGWIPTSERLPDNDRAVLVTLKWAEDDYEVAVGEYWHNSTASHGWGSIEGHVIAWHELPTPYREWGYDGTD